MVSKLLDLDDKYNPISEVFEYEYLPNDTVTKLFRVVYGEVISIEYWNSVKFRFEKNIKVWQHGDVLSDMDLDSFIRFIVKESNLYVLYEMEEEIVQNGVRIKRV